MFKFSLLEFCKIVTGARLPHYSMPLRFALALQAHIDYTASVRSGSREMFTPARIDTTGNFGVPSDYVGGSGAQPDGAIQALGALYYVLASRTIAKLFMFKSTDGGATWVALDAANGPVPPGLTLQCFGSCFNPAANKITCAFEANLATDINLQDFDLIAETWGVPYATVAPPVIGGAGNSPVYATFRPSNGTIIVIWEQFAAFVTRVRAAVWNGAIWTQFFVDANRPVGITVSYSPKIVLDDSGNDTLHVVMLLADSFGYITNDLFYQSILITNALSVFSIIMIGLPAPTDPIFFGAPIQDGTRFLIPASGLDGASPIAPARMGLIIGTPKGAPVVWINKVTVDPAASNDPNFVGVTPAIIFDALAGRLHYVYSLTDISVFPFLSLSIRHLVTSDLAALGSWTAETIFNAEGSKYANANIIPPGQKVDAETLTLDGSILQIAFNMVNPPGVVYPTVYQQRFFGVLKTLSALIPDAVTGYPISCSDWQRCCQKGKIT